MALTLSFDYLFTYDAWANRETLASIRAAGAPPRSLKCLAHIVAAEWLWYERIRQSGSKVVVWPDLTPDECAAEIERLAATWHDYVHDMPDAILQRTFAYTNTKGEHWESRVQDILLHVIMHSVYHRGQIAADVRASGHTPAYTDYIQYVRAVQR